MRFLLSLAVMALLAIPSAVMAMPLGPSQAAAIGQPESVLTEVKHGGDHGSGGYGGGGGSHKYYQGNNYSNKNYNNKNYGNKNYGNKNYNNKYYPNKHYNNKYYGRPNYRYDQGHRYYGGPPGWRRYGYRPDNWGRRGCILIGPYWFCP